MSNFNSRQSYKVTAPVARSTAYDYNATLSKSHTRAANPSGKSLTAVQCSTDEDRDVMPHEVLFEHKGRALTNNARICSASSVNGVTLGHACVRAVQSCLRDCGCEHADAFSEPMRPMSDPSVKGLHDWLLANTEHRDKVSDTLTSFFNYMGVAVTGCTSGPRGGTLQRQGFSATRGGLMTVVNTGSKALRAGDKVRMVIDVLDVVRGSRPNEDQITGIPRTKVVARLAHLPETSHVFNDVANGITSRDMIVNMHLPGVLTPRLEYMGRSCYPWDWDHRDETDANRRVRLNQSYIADNNGLGVFAANGLQGVANAAAAAIQAEQAIPGNYNRGRTGGVGNPNWLRTKVPPRLIAGIFNAM